MFKFICNYFRPKNKHSHSQYGYLFERAATDRWVCLDLELTGLDPKKHSILSVGAVPIYQQNQSLVIDTANALSIVCRPLVMPDTDSIVIHGLRPMDLQNGVSYDAMLDKLLPLIGACPIVGFCTAMDMAFLNTLIKPKIGTKLPNRTVDVSILDQTLRQKQNKHGHNLVDKRHLKELLTAYQIPRLPAHDAMNDALMTAMLFCHLQRHLG